MPQIQEQTIETWSKLTEFAERHDVASGFDRSYAFRGHSEVEWQLDPTLHRSATLDGSRPLPPVEELLRLETRLLERFKQEATTFLPHAIIHSSHHAVDWWPIMRHYGVPTRLLDWTTSLYVASYFAAATKPSKDGAIHMLHLNALDTAMTKVHGVLATFDGNALERTVKQSDAPRVLHMIGRATSHLDRMVAQQCCFMCGVNVATNLQVELATHLSAQHIIKIRIPSKLKPEIMHRQ